MIIASEVGKKAAVPRNENSLQQEAHFAMIMV